jgi:glutathione synthase
MSLNLVFQTDPLARLNVAGDTSFALMLEAQARGHAIFQMEPNDVAYENGRVSALVRSISVVDDPARAFSVHETWRRDLRDFDVLLIRQDPPFDMAYYANTLLLEMLEPDVLVLNAPHAVRNVSEKLAALQFPDLMPETWVGRDKAALVAFAQRFPMVVVKPLFHGGGETVTRTATDLASLLPHVETALAAWPREPILVQEYLPEVPEQGDKRIMLLEGEPVGVLKRIPAKGDFRANIHVGGRPVLSEIEERDRLVVARVGEMLRREGVFFAGIDVLAGRLIEINVTSPTLMRELKRAGGPDVALTYMERVEQRLAGRR